MVCFGFGLVWLTNLIGVFGNLSSRLQRICGGWTIIAIIRLAQSIKAGARLNTWHMIVHLMDGLVKNIFWRNISTYLKQICLSRLKEKSSQNCITYITIL